MTRDNPANTAALGALLVVAGILFLITQFFGFELWSVGWPFPILVVGLFFFLGMFVGGRGAGALAIPGSVITMVGLILAFQNSFGHWESWSYAWTLVFFAVGIGMFLMGLWENRPQTRQTGLAMAGVGFALFLFLGAFFEMGFGPWGFGRAGIVLWGLLLMAAGFLLILRPQRFLRSSTPREPQRDEPPGSKPASGHV